MSDDQWWGAQRLNQIPPRSLRHKTCSRDCCDYDQVHDLKLLVVSSVRLVYEVISVAVSFENPMGSVGGVPRLLLDSGLSAWWRQLQF